MVDEQTWKKTKTRELTTFALHSTEQKAKALLQEGVIHFQSAHRSKWNHHTHSIILLGRLVYFLQIYFVNIILQDIFLHYSFIPTGRMIPYISNIVEEMTTYTTWSRSRQNEGETKGSSQRNTTISSQHISFLSTTIYINDDRYIDIDINDDRYY